MRQNKTRQIRWVAVVIGTLVLSSVGCSSPETSSWNDPGPEASFKTFLRSWFQADRSKAFEMIVPEDRETLTASLELVDKRIDQAELERHEMLVAGRVDNLYDLERIEAEPKLEREPEAGTRVELTLVYHDGRSGEATMMWGGERWYVDLPLEEQGAENVGSSRSSAGKAGDTGRSESKSGPDAGSEDGEMMDVSEMGGSQGGSRE